MGRRVVLFGFVASVVIGAAALLATGPRPSETAGPPGPEAAAEHGGVDHGGMIERTAPAEPGPSTNEAPVAAPAVDRVAFGHGMTATEAERMGAASRWCPPLAAISGDMEALRCWVTLAAGEMDLDLPLNFGDLPAWTEIDADALGEALTAYEDAAAEQRRIDEERARTQGRGATTTRAPAPRPGVQLASDEAGLRHQCHTQRLPAACDALFDLMAGGGTYNPDSPPSTPARPDPTPPPPFEEPQWDLEAPARLHAERIAELRRIIEESCPDGGSGDYYAGGGTVLYVWNCSNAPETVYTQTR